MSTPSPAKVKVQSTTPSKPGGWKKKIAFGGSKARAASSLDEISSSGATSTPSGGGEKQTQEQMEVTMEKQLSEPVFTKVCVSIRLFVQLFFSDTLSSLVPRLLPVLQGVGLRMRLYTYMYTCKTCTFSVQASVFMLDFCIAWWCYEQAKAVGGGTTEAYSRGERTATAATTTLQFLVTRYKTGHVVVTWQIL